MAAARATATTQALNYLCEELDLLNSIYKFRESLVGCDHRTALYIGYDNAHENVGVDLTLPPQIRLCRIDALAPRVNSQLFIKIRLLFRF